MALADMKVIAKARTPMRAGTGRDTTVSMRGTRMPKHGTIRVTIVRIERISSSLIRS